MAKDLKNPKMRSIGIRRAVGLTIAGGFAHALEELSKVWAGVDDDEEEAIRLLAPPWSENSNFAFLDRDEDGLLRYIDLSFIDPYNIWKRPVTAVMRDEPWHNKAADVLREALVPFLGTDIAAGAIFEVLANTKETGSNVYREHDLPHTQLSDIANHLRRALQPGIASQIERTWAAAKGERSRSGKQYKLSDEMWAWGGWRVTTFDPKIGLYYRLFAFQDAKRDAAIRFNRTVFSPNKVTSRELESAYAGANRIRAKAYSDMAKIISATRNSGMVDFEIRRVLKNSRVSQEDINALMRGEIPKWKPTKQSLANQEKKARVLFKGGERLDFRERYHRLDDIIRAAER